jgi:hypothetical protein
MPIVQWLLQAITIVSGALMNNLVFAFSVPPAIQIVFSPAGKLFCPNSLSLHPHPFLPFALPDSSFLSSFLVCDMIVLKVWIVHRTGHVHDPRPRLHGQAMYATTNSTSPSGFPFSLASNGAPALMLAINPLLPLPLFFFSPRPDRVTVPTHRLLEDQQQATRTQQTQLPPRALMLTHRGTHWATRYL